MTPWVCLYPYLPERWITALKALTYQEQNGIRELHLQEEGPLLLVTDRGVRYLTPTGMTALRQPGVLHCSRGELARCVASLCQESVYAYQEQLRQGFLPLPGGIRVGVAGRAMVRGQEVVGVEHITTLCIRLPGRHQGCAGPVLTRIWDGDGLHSTLLVGEPSSGKTTLLRDVAAGLAARRLRVTVVDERDELAGVDGLPGCDVLSGYPKAVGILQAVRCLSPQVIVFDELGELEEVQAVAACANAGVTVVSSLHGRSPEEVACRPAARLLAGQGVFERWLFLAGRNRPGQVEQGLCPEVTEGEIHWTCVDCGGGSRFGLVRLPPSGEAGSHTPPAGAGDGVSAPSAYLFGTAYGGAVAATGGN